MKNNFKEKKLGSNFCKEKVKEIKKLISESTTFSVVGMPGLGTSMFLKYLATLNFAKFIHIDCNELTSPIKKDLFELLDKTLGNKANLALPKMVLKEKRIVIIFNRFDRLSKEFDYNFLANLRSLRDIDKEKIVMIFALNQPLTESFPDSISGGNLNMFSKTYYLKPFTGSDLDKLILLNTPIFRKRADYKNKLLLSGGHYQLLQLLLKDDPPAVRLQLKELYEYLNITQRKQLQKIAFNKSIKLSSIDSKLFNLGYVNKQSVYNRVIIVPKLLEEYIKSNSRLKLPVKEEKLFKLLKSKINKVILKDQIFKELWLDGEGTDWALNALIYRLKKNPTFASSGYLIENHKKVGYSLIKIN